MTTLETRDALIDALRHDLIGPMREDEIIEQRPTRWYLAGFLVPRGMPIDDASDPTDNEDVSALPASGEEDDQGDAAIPAPRAWFPSSCGLTVLVPPGAGQLQAWLRWGEYSQLSMEETAACYQRYRPSSWVPADEPADETEALPGEAAPEAAEPRRRRRPPPPLWRRVAHTAGPVALLLDTGSRLTPIPGVPGLTLRVDVRRARSPGLPDGARTVSVFVVNDRPPGEGARADEAAIFQVELELRCDAGLLSRTSVHQRSSDDADEARVDLQYRDYGEWAVGHNVSALAAPPEGERVHTVRTTWLPSVSVHRMRTHEIDAVPVAMADLADLPSAAALVRGLEPLLTEYTAWIADQRRVAADLGDEARRRVAEELARGADRAMARIRAGLSWLGRDPLGWEAFRLANRAMDLAARQARPELYSDGQKPTWRLFQLAFLLINIPGVGEPAHPDRAVVELLFFPTGGGKTEAYLGVAAFVLALRRLRGRDQEHEGAGVSVLLRYTLRMLTLDQLGRAATLVGALEVLRRASPERLGRRRFQVGLWVGRSATPNRIEDAEKQLSFYKSNPGDRRRAPPMPLHECPWCRTPFVIDCYTVKVEGGVKVLRVGCASGDCPFHFDHSENKGVPVVVIDDQIYRELPCFLIATVDKFAGLPRVANAGALFGRVRAKDDQGFYTDQTAPVSAKRFARGLPPPDLVLQDELHLITGPLGTMVGLYETALGELARDAGGFRPKIIASTATARGAARQVRALYAASKVETFPPPGLDPKDSFFAITNTSPTSTRRYVGVAAPGRNVKAVAVRVYSALLSAAYRAWRRGAKEEKNPADTYMTLLAYFNTLRELGGAQRLVQEEVAPRCARLEDRRAFQDSESGTFWNRPLSFEPLELTSRQSTDQIRLASARLKAPYQSEVGGRNDVVLASSMISVGVDIPRLGLMVMNGQPKTVAEYIQATSRVGRETPGLVVTLFNLRRPRDRSHFERFIAFHECFYRMVEASSVTPFSGRALDRGLAAVLVGLARHLWPALTPPKAAADVERAGDLLPRLVEILKARAAATHDGAPTALSQQVGDRTSDLLQEWRGLAAELRRDQVSLVYSPWEVKGGTPLLSTAVDPVPEKYPKLVRFRAPTSMRDVEVGVHIWTVNSLGGEDT